MTLIMCIIHFKNWNLFNFAVGINGAVKNMLNITVFNLYVIFKREHSLVQFLASLVLLIQDIHWPFWTLLFAIRILFWSSLLFASFQTGLLRWGFDYRGFVTFVLFAQLLTIPLLPLAAACLFPRSLDIWLRLFIEINSFLYI